MKSKVILSRRNDCPVKFESKEKVAFELVYPVVIGFNFDNDSSEPSVT